MQVKLHKILGGAGLRTETVTGTLLIARTNPVQSRLPEVGEQPIVYNDKPVGTKQGENGRMFNTSPIVKVYDVDGGRQITTESGSIYFLEPLDETEE